MAGVTLAGFETKRFNEIILGLRENAVTIFQDLVAPGEEVDVSDNSTIGRLIGLIAPDLAELWQADLEVYQAFDPNSATGVALDNIVQYMGVTRRQGRPTVLRASVWGLVGTSLPQGQVIKGEGSTKFVSTAPLVFSAQDLIGFSVVPTSIVVGVTASFTMIVEEGIYTLTHTNTSGGTVDDILNAWLTQFNAGVPDRYSARIESGKFYVELKEYFAFITVPSLTNSSIVDVKRRLVFNSETNGDYDAPIGTVTNILTPVFGWTSVINEVGAEPGSTLETDEELRERFRVSKAVRASNTGEALYSQLLELEGVTFARVYENMTDSTDLNGLPEHSFMAIVRGGVNTDIGKVVWRNKPLGIASFGTESVVILDSQMLERTVYFSRPTEVPIYVKVQVKKIDNTFPEDGVEMIRRSILEYLQGNITFGEDVIYTRMFTPINAIPGHQVELLQIGKSLGSLGTSNIPITWKEFPTTFLENIDVTLVT